MMKHLTLMLTVCCLTGCLSTQESRGYRTDLSDISQVTAGQSKQDVFSVLGSPTSRSHFGGERWYYIGQETSHVAFMNEDVKNQTTYVVAFNDNGTVAHVSKNHGELARNVNISNDKTPTEGNEYSLTEQLIGNIGKFNQQEAQ